VKATIEDSIVMDYERGTTRYQSLALLDHVISVFRDGKLVEEFSREFVSGLLNHLGSVQPHPEPQ
jgi:hypothetical protein